MVQIWVLKCQQFRSIPVHLVPQMLTGLNISYQQSHRHALDPIVGDGDHPVVLAELGQVADVHHGGQAGPKYVSI